MIKNYYESVDRSHIRRCRGESAILVRNSEFFLMTALEMMRLLFVVLMIHTVANEKLTFNIVVMFVELTNIVVVSTVMVYLLKLVLISMNSILT